MATPFPFGSGNVLTAAQMNAITTLPVSTKTTSHTLTIDDLGTRVVMNSATATTITVNTSIFGASDKVEIFNIGAGVCTVTAGTCTVGTTGTLALVQNAGGTLTFISASASVFTAGGVAASASALVFINATSFTTQTTVSMAAGTFTSTFKNYLVILDHQPGGSGGAAITYRFNAAGTPVTGANYQGSKSFISSAGSQTLTGSSSATSLPMGQSGGTTGGGGTMTVYNPVSATTMTDVSGTFAAQGIGSFGGTYEVNEAHDGLTFIFATSSTGFYRVYGLADA